MAKKKTKKNPKRNARPKQKPKPRKQIRSAATGGAQPVPPSPGELHKILARLPALAGEPEMSGRGLDGEALARAIAEDEPAPETIGRLAHPSFHAHLLVGLNDIKVRAIASEDDELRFLTDSASFFIEDVRGPPWDNPLIVAIYYRDRARLSGNELSPSEIVAAAKGYETEYKALLDEKLHAMVPPMIG